jgi:excinuclease ABC subunit A
VKPDYHGHVHRGEGYVLETFAKTESAAMKRRVAQYLVSGDCPACRGKRLPPRAAVGDGSPARHRRHGREPLKKLAASSAPSPTGTPGRAKSEPAHPEQAEVARRIAGTSTPGWPCCSTSGLGYLTLERSTPTLSPGELQRLRLATQVRSNLFGVVYVLDEPSAGLHPADTERCWRASTGSRPRELAVRRRARTRRDPPRRLARRCRAGGRANRGAAYCTAARRPG